MSKKGLVLLAIIILAFSCKPTEPTPSDTTLTTTSVATDTTPAPSATIAPPLPDFKLDHFKFWRVERKVYAETIGLFGQADREWWEAKTVAATFLGNPVRKKHDGQVVSTPQFQLHYVVYRLDTQPQRPRRVVLSNQITKNERQEWYITNPEWLLVPAGKTMQGEPQPQRGDHFACYAVYRPKPIPVNIELQDQFDVRLQQRWEKIPELTPAYFCIPVQKRRKGKEPEQLINPETHLAIYGFKPEKIKPITALTRDQFRRNTLTVLSAEWLGVPTRKWEKPVETELPN